MILTNDNRILATHLIESFYHSERAQQILAATLSLIETLSDQEIDEYTKHVVSAAIHQEELKQKPLASLRNAGHG